VNEWDDMRQVRMSKVLMERLLTRDDYGRRLTVDWGEPRDGFYEPTISAHGEDAIIFNSRADLEATLRDAMLKEGLDGTENQSYHSWRCQHPDRYGPCDCFTTLVSDLADRLTNHGELSPHKMLAPMDDEPEVPSGGPD
jgi:hypothetical protein